WDGSVYTTIQFELRDDETNRPVEGAIVFAGHSGFDTLQSIRTEMKEAYLATSSYIGKTNAQGITRVAFHSRAGGGRFLFWDTGRYHIEEDIIIQAKGYDDIRTLAQNLLGQKTFSVRNREHTTSVYMTKIKTEPNKTL